MIPVTTFRDQKVALFGLGGSGLATAEALRLGGCEVVAWDDNPASRDTAIERGIICQDLRDADLSQCVALILAPGVPLTHPAPHWSVVLAQGAGLPIIGDVELFQRELRASDTTAKFVAITGTNGKSTTTALTSHILANAGVDVHMGGNIGTAVLLLEPPQNKAVYVVECSSYQIDLAPGLAPDVGVLLNLTPDHLDRHGDMQHYADVKSRLIEGAAVAIVNVDDSHSKAIAEKRWTRAGLVRISKDKPMESGFFASGGNIFQSLEDGPVQVGDLAKAPALPGDHNAQNALAAFAACKAVGLSNAQIQAGMESFPGLAHRMERVAMRDDVLFINDSKATNAEAAAPALSSFERVHWIVGGIPKTGGIEPLWPIFGHIDRAYLIGEAAQDFSGTLSAHRVPFDICETLERAVETANDAVGKAGVVLLSPACASFDQYKNFEIRGEAFRSAVMNLSGAVAIGPAQNTTSKTA